MQDISELGIGFTRAKLLKAKSMRTEGRSNVPF